MKILIFGGTFNPVHNGHIAMCKAAQKTVNPDLTLIIPTYMPPHKAVNGNLLSGEERIKLCRLAFDGFDNTEVSDIEIKAEQKSYSVITLTKLHEIYPDAEFYMLCGADMFLTLKTWFKYEEIIKLTAICAVPRDGGLAELEEYKNSVEADGGKCIIIDTPTVEISSTEIREAINSGGNADGMLPKNVLDYIIKHNLFR
ncbi:MAG: nicotinate (nicotinamide) nucleotide adenylyltransferase [Acutalibacteraceae bacterium]|nr:nicotinate (nicotinamide) nucleotide adenylyltransferase [Acutalibacteraceae bacterium]